MDTKSLVLLRSNFNKNVDSNDFVAGKFYRHIADEDNKFHYVNGVMLNNNFFTENFEFVYDVIVREFAYIGLLKSDGSALSKKAFTDQLNIIEYGRGRTKVRIGFAYSSSRDLMFGFYGGGVCTKANFVTSIYNQYLSLVKSKSVSGLECGLIQRGNCGIPIGYGSLRYRQDLT